MARINEALLERLKDKLSIKKSQVYSLIQDKVSETSLPPSLAAIKLAMDKGVNISKYATEEDLRRIREPSYGRISPATIAPIARRSLPTETDRPLKLDLTFIRNKDIQQILQRDIGELNSARAVGIAKTKKTCMILAGSIAETILLGALLKKKKTALLVASTLPNKPDNDMEKWNLFDMIQVASAMTPKMLATDMSSMGTTLKDWRNLIHPGRELKDAKRRGVWPTTARAKSAIAFLEQLVDELKCPKVAKIHKKR